MPIKLNGATNGSVELDVPAAVGSDLQITLPATAGEVVVKDGSGNITTTGSATFGGNVDLGNVNTSSNSNTGSKLETSGQLLLQLSSSVGAGNQNGIAVYYGNTLKTTIKNDGSATFASTITAGNESSTGTNIFASGSAQGIVGGTQKWYLGTDGSATFAGTITQSAFNTSSNAATAKGFAAYDSGQLIVQGSSGVTAGQQVSLAVYNGTTQKFGVLNNGNATFSGSVTASNVSDIRFKENITDANPQLADAVALGSQLKNFDWNDDAPLNEELRAKRFLGLVAQEAEKVCPGLTYTVSRTKQGAELTPEATDEEGNVTPATYEELDDSYKAINHDILVMKLLGAVAEQNTQIEALKTKVVALEASS